MQEMGRPSICNRANLRIMMSHRGKWYMTGYHKISKYWNKHTTAHMVYTICHSIFHLHLNADLHYKTKLLHVETITLSSGVPIFLSFYGTGSRLDRSPVSTVCYVSMPNEKWPHTGQLSSQPITWRNLTKYQIRTPMQMPASQQVFLNFHSGKLRSFIMHVLADWSDFPLLTKYGPWRICKFKIEGLHWIPVTC